MCVCVVGGRGERQTEAERFEELAFWGYNSMYISEITATWFSRVPAKYRFCVIKAIETAAKRDANCRPSLPL